MKKIIIVLLVLVISLGLLAGCTSPIKIVDKELLVTDWNSYGLLSEFVQKHPNRTSGDKTTLDPSGELQADSAAKWIGEKMISYGYSGDNYGRTKFVYENPFVSNRSEETYNVIFRKDNPTTDKQVIIGTHYDNAAKLTKSDKVIGGEGVYNNAVGVVALLQLAKQLVGVELPYDVEFVFFGAGEMGRKGSLNYIKNMTDIAKSNTLLMINYDRVVGGDYLYMYSDEVAWGHESFFYNVAADNKYNVTEMPANKRPALNATLEGSNLMYYNEFMLSDNISFLWEDIPTISFTSLNASSRSNAAYVEIDGKNNVDYTAADTLLEMKERLGGGEKGEKMISSGIDTVVNITIKSMTSEQFVSAMESSLAAKPDYKGIANYKTMQIIAYSVTGGIILLLIVLYFVLKSKLTKHDVIVESPRGGYVNMTKGIIMPTGLDNANQSNVDPFGGSSAPPSNAADPFDVGFDNKDTPKLESGKPSSDDKDIFGNY